MVVIEVMGVGKFVLVSMCGGMMEFVKENIMGFYLKEFMIVDFISSDILKMLVNFELIVVVK